MAGLTLDNPVSLEVALASANVIPGDTLYLRGGTYALADMEMRWHGTAEAPITLTPYDNEPVIFQPASGARIMLISGDYFKMTGNLVFDGAGVDQECIKITNTGVEIPVGIELDGFEIKNAPMQGVLISNEATVATLKNLNIHHHGTTKDHHGIYVSDGIVTIHGCVCHNNSGHGIHVYGGHSDTVVFENYCHDNGEMGIGLYSYKALCYNNVCRRNESNLRVRYYVTDIQCYNNTLMEGRADNLEIRAITNEAFFGKFYNNLCIGSPLGVYFEMFYPDVNLPDNRVELYNNLSFGATIQDLLIDFRDVNRVIQVNNLFGTDPAPYTDDSAENVHPLSDSALLAAGLAVTGITTDYGGNVRGNPPTIGAWE